LRNKVLLLTLFGLAMAYMEASVVVYLREIVYPGGFSFPLRQIATRLAVVEVAREASTLLMLVAVAYLAERTRHGRFACFLFLFGLWDIGYYLWLWVSIGWPQTLLTWDILFLIPLIWTGPVLAPVLVSCLFLAAGLIYYLGGEWVERVRISRLDWLLTIVSAAIIFAAFAYNHGPAAGGGVPRRFPWEVFIPGLVLGAFLLIKIVGSGLKMTQSEGSGPEHRHFKT
jgi:hypothetical protein